MIKLKDIINLLDFEIVSLFYKGSWISYFKGVESIKSSGWINEKVISIGQDNSVKQSNVEIYLTDKNRSY